MVFACSVTDNMDAREDMENYMMELYASLDSRKCVFDFEDECKDEPKPKWLRVRRNEG